MKIHKESVMVIFSWSETRQSPGQFMGGICAYILERLDIQLKFSWRLEYFAYRDILVKFEFFIEKRPN